MVLVHWCDEIDLMLQRLTRKCANCTLVLLCYEFSMYCRASLVYFGSISPTTSIRMATASADRLKNSARETKLLS